jgi:hypothetical protein
MLLQRDNFVEKIWQLAVDFGLIAFFVFVSHEIPLIITNFIFCNSLVISAPTEILSYEGVLELTKIATAIILLLTALYRFVDLIKNKKKD